MGSPESEAERYDDERQHKVTLTEGFWLADTACTQAIWKTVTGNNPSEFGADEDSGDELPVENITFEDVQDFLALLNERLSSGSLFKLPTEAQWEYACRAGTKSPFSFGETITTDQANFDGNFPYANAPQGEYRKKTVAAKSLPCNPWGLYQMHGNVWEWCSDWYGAYSIDELIDPAGPTSGSGRVMRGGSWFFLARFVRSACRDRLDPGSRNLDLGFRLLSSASSSQVA
jgi:formylglycine-generating enzyme required for sulfatase activity